MDEIGELRPKTLDNSDSGHMNSDFIKERKDKFSKFFTKGQKWVVVLLIIAIILGMYIRALPMTEHQGGNPGLYDITTKTWTLGPDLDPWLFLRSAETILNEGSLPAIDHMRNVPLGFDNSIESQLLPYMIVYTHKIANLFGDYPIEFAGVVFPVIMFGLTIITFFLFVRELFLRRTKKGILKANIIAIIATFFMIVTPVFLSRTIAGIPEKESAAFFFLFLAFYLFLKAWKSNNVKKSVLFGLLAGISTGLMGLIWGGVIYVLIPLAIATLFAFILGKVRKRHFYAYGLWAIVSTLMLALLSGRYGLIERLTSLSSGSACLVFFVMVIHYMVWDTKIKNINFINKNKLPRTILSFIIAIILLVILSVIFFGPGFVIEKIKVVHQTIFKPVSGRWNITVAENRQPNFQEWSGSFGPYFKNIPLMFWLFFIGSIVLFKKMLLRLKNKDSWILTASFVFLLSGIIYSRYSSSSVFNGDNFISKAFYYISVLVFLIVVVKYYLDYYRRGDNSFSKIRYEYLVLFALFIFTLFTVRGAVRLIMVLGPISTIFAGFLIVELVDRYFKTKEDIGRVLIGLFIILVLIASIYTFYIYYQSVNAQAYNFIPSSYNIQWQKAMSWVRDNTPSNAAFSHWWDYGYWVQSMGKRATMVDGGNAVTYWNYLVGRHVLTGDNQDDALELLYNHNISYFLIDSTDIGKYTAFSSIGSDENFDRYSFISPFLLDESRTQETNNMTLYIYPGGIGLDEDLIINQNGKEILLPANSAGIGAVVVPFDNIKQSYSQPYIIVVYQGQQYNVNMRYLYIKGHIFDFGSGIEATTYIFPKLIVNGGQVSANEAGAALFLSPRLMKGMLAQVYILEDALGNFPNFKLAHAESALIIDDLRAQGLQLPEFVYYNGILGPIKIWKIEYTGKEKIKEEYVDKDASKYISWRL